MNEIETNTVIVGASAAGLACAARLKKAQVPYEILEQHSHVAHAWRNHYDRLHLHTNKGFSALPFLPFPEEYPKYPSRDQVVEYLERYADRLELQPNFNQRVTSIRRGNGGWVTETERGDSFISDNVIVATGYSRKPHIPTWEGQELYKGPILHSSQYKNGRPFSGERVLVVGFGNSACEIVLCLYEHGAEPAMSVRSPVNIVPRDILGIPVLSIGIFLSNLPPRLADTLNAPLLRLLVGDYTQYGLEKPDYGPVEQIKKHRQVPVLDIGTLDLIKKGEVTIYGDIERFYPEGVIFEEEGEEQFDAVILGTGYRPAVHEFLEHYEEVTDEERIPIRSGEETQLPGLYFCGFYVSNTGMLRAIYEESEKIADSISQKDLSVVAEKT